MTVLFTISMVILAALLAAATWCAVSHTGEKEGICNYGYIQEEDTRK